MDAQGMARSTQLAWKSRVSGKVGKSRVSGFHRKVGCLVSTGFHLLVSIFWFPSGFPVEDPCKRRLQTEERPKRGAVGGSSAGGGTEDYDGKPEFSL